ncbi:MAG TPA: hypothetical protein DCX79_04650 [Planctomycetaceae bacterium]|nr:hypothetical protein [Planctomycetaceae bacterium]
MEFRFLQDPCRHLSRQQWKLNTRVVWVLLMSPKDFSPQEPAFSRTVANCQELIPSGHSFPLLLQAGVGVQIAERL